LKSKAPPEVPANGPTTAEANRKAAETIPKDICWFCPEQHAAVEPTFVQFDRTLKPVAKNLGTYNEAREKVG
jgi:hypothetical protein